MKRNYEEKRHILKVFTTTSPFHKLIVSDMSYYLLVITAKDCVYCVRYKAKFRGQLIKKLPNIRGTARISYKEVEANSLKTLGSDIKKEDPRLLKLLAVYGGVPCFSIVTQRDYHSKNKNTPLPFSLYGVIGVNEKGEGVRNPKKEMNISNMAKWVYDVTRNGIKPYKTIKSAKKQLNNTHKEHQTTKNDNSSNRHDVKVITTYNIDPDTSSEDDEISRI